jgi:putative ABC transport system permease protein
LSEFATLRAMGSSRPFLYKVIVWQALMTAVIGFAIAASIGLIVARVSTDTALPIILPPVLIAGLFALTVGMSVASAFSAMMVVTRVDPVTVLAR